MVLIGATSSSTRRARLGGAFKHPESGDDPVLVRLVATTILMAWNVFPSSVFAVSVLPISQFP